MVSCASPAGSVLTPVSQWGELLYRCQAWLAAGLLFCWIGCGKTKAQMGQLP